MVPGKNFFMRRWIPLLVALQGSILLGSSLTGAGDFSRSDAPFVEITREMERAVDRGLEYLRRAQNSDGSWNGFVGFKYLDDYTVTSGDEIVPHVGVSSLACLSFLSNGSLPLRGRYGKELEKGLDYVMRQVKEDGYITANGTRMYSHAFSTLFLAEAYGMTHRPDVQEKLRSAVDLIIDSQNALGSWRYLPFAVDSDMSITVCQVMALRAARNAGIRVPKSTIDRAVKYVMDSAITFGQGRGGFKYQLRTMNKTRTSYSLTAAGITTLFNAGVYRDSKINEGLEYLIRHFREPRRDHYFYFYGNYYAVQAMYIAGGRYWQWYFPAIREELLRLQEPGGNWKNNVGPGPDFATAVATLILQIPYRYLPIFQR